MTIHVVKKGDTIWNIAKQYNVSTGRIINDNAIADPKNLVIGQALIILIPKTVYTIRKGDTLTSVAAQFGTSAMILLQNNPYLINSPFLIIGQTITVSFEGEKRREIPINAYAYPHIKKDVLIRALPYLTYLTIFGYGFTVDGELISINDQPLIDLAYKYKTAPVMLLSSVTEDGNFDGHKASILFNDTNLQNKVINNVIAVMSKKGYVGLDVDFEYIEAKDKMAYIGFLKNITLQMHEHGFFVNTDLAPKTSSEQVGLLYEAHDYAAIGKVSDTVLIMTYEWGYTYGPPMAVAPIPQVREVVSYAVSQIPSGKIMMGIPNYGYDWALPFERGMTKAVNIGNQSAVELAARHGVEIQFDETAQSPYFEYFAQNGVKHIVWFEDVRSILSKFNVMDEYKLRGAGYWSAMRPFAQNWALISALYTVRKVIKQ